jgi:hypothetical protein
VAWWGLAGGIAALLFLPWLPVALRQTGYYPGLGSPHPAWALALDMVNVLSIGVATTRFAFRAGLAPFVGLAALGAVNLTPRPPLRRGEGEPTVSLSHTLSRRDGGQVPGKLPLSAPERGPGGEVFFLLLWLLLPIAGILILSRSRPLYEPRFLMLVLPAWAIMVGAGLVALGRGVRWLTRGRLRLPPLASRLATMAVGVVVAGLLLIPTTRSLASYFFDPAYARDNYRGLAQAVMLREEPGDAIVLTAPGQAEIFGYYYRGTSDLVPLPRQRPIDLADTRSRLEALSRSHQRVWLVLWASEEADPDDFILDWLEGQGQRIAGGQYGSVELRLYDLNATALAGPSATARRDHHDTSAWAPARPGPGERAGGPWG